MLGNDQKQSLLRSSTEGLFARAVTCEAFLHSSSSLGHPSTILGEKDVKKTCKMLQFHEGSSNPPLK